MDKKKMNKKGIGSELNKIILLVLLLVLLLILIYQNGQDMKNYVVGFFKW
jgi:uncharacterized integral membrane protein